MRRVGFVLGAVVLLALLVAPAFAAQPFSDVPQDHWAYNAIDKLASQGLIEGYPDGTFKGKRNMTRYEFAVAIARLMDRIEAMGVGKVGPPGPQGPAGPAGSAGSGGGLTDEQKALLNRLATEFAPELQALRSDLNALTKRVEDLEAKVLPPAPVVTIGGNIDWRTGVYGTKLGFENVRSTGYFDAPFVDADDSAIPVSDTLKDAFKNGDFMTMRTRVFANANISASTSAFVQLLAGPTTNLEDPHMFFESPNFFTGNGLMDVVQFDQIWLKHGTRFITPVELTVGKQYLRRGVGLLFDNDQEAIKGVRADFGTGSLRVGTLLAMLDNEQFFGRTGSVPNPAPIVGDPAEINGQDNINLLYLDWAFAGDWKLGGNWLNSGFNEEAGWSVSLTGPFYGLGLYGEYAKLTQWPNGKDFADNNDNGIADAGEPRLDDADAAWLAGVKWANPWLGLQVEYGQVDAGYAIAFSGGGWDTFSETGFFNLPLSALHPRAEIDPHDINWIDRPLFLDATNIAKGWHFQATFPTLLRDMPLTVSYATGDGYNPDFLGWLSEGGSTSGLDKPEMWRDADPFWWVKLSRQMSSSVTASLLYGRREVDKIVAPDEPRVDRFNDPIDRKSVV